jgi:hypothetical protein
MNLYTIVFDDSSIYKGGDLRQPKWLEIPDKKIRSIFYQLPLGDNLVLSGYDKYYHYVEVTSDITGEKKGEVQLEFAYSIGKNRKECKLYKINLRTGQVEIKILEEKDKEISQLNPIGWK